MTLENEGAIPIYERRADMNKKAMDSLSYGLYVLTARENERDNGCIINTAFQVTSRPNRIAFAVNQSNLTHDMLLRTGRCNLSVLSTDADFSIFERFGFKTGKDDDKFRDFSDFERSGNGLIYITKGTKAYLCCEAESMVALETHTLFVVKVKDMDVLSDAPSLTYDYYHERIKPKDFGRNPDEVSEKIFRCDKCGYEFVGEGLPEDFVCPICGMDAPHFKEVESLI